MNLIDKKCAPCEGGIEPMAEEKIQQYLSLLKNDWAVVDGKKIRHEFAFKDFKQAMAFINKVAEVAEGEGHHPDLHIFYNKVIIELWTHAIGGLSENDFIVAAKVERLI